MFVLMKLAEMASAPLNLVLLALVAAVVLFARGRKRSARRLVVIATAIMVLIAAVPWAGLLVAPLEDRFPVPAPPEKVDGIIVLGGAIDPFLSARRNQPAVTGAAERLLVMAALARRYPEAVLVYTGGSGTIRNQELKEAPVAREILASLGVDLSRVIFEGQSRNTWENAVLSRELVHPRPDQTWLLVTSAWHMPRSVGVFRAAGWSVLPYPVDYTTAGSGVGPLGVDAGLEALRIGMHEWLGMVYYHWRGWCSGWFPGP